MSYTHILQQRAKKNVATKLIGSVHVSDVLKFPITTEKSMKMAEGHAISTKKTYSFYVDTRANKTDVSHAIQSMYKVSVENVRMVNLIVKRRNQKKIVRPALKKAYITLPKGSAIEIVA